MGSSFFHAMYDPIGAMVSEFAPNSTVGKIVQNDPLNNALGTEQKTPTTPAPGGAGAYAGVAPTLAAAANGYQTPAATAGYSAQQPQQQQPRPGGMIPNLRAWS